MGAQKRCSSASRVIEHCTARPRTCETKVTSFPSEETKASAARVLSMVYRFFVDPTAELPRRDSQQYQHYHKSWSRRLRKLTRPFVWSQRDHSSSLATPAADSSSA